MSVCMIKQGHPCAQHVIIISNSLTRPLVCVATLRHVWMHCASSLACCSTVSAKLLTAADVAAAAADSAYHLEDTRWVCCYRDSTDWRDHQRLRGDLCHLASSDAAA